MTRPWVFFAVLLAGILFFGSQDAYAAFDADPAARLVGVGAPSGVATARFYIEPNGADERSIIDLRKRLIAAGAEKVNLFVPAMIIVCDVPSSVDLAAVVGDTRCAVLTEEAADAAIRTGRDAGGIGGLAFVRACSERRLDPSASRRFTSADGHDHGGILGNGGTGFDDVVKFVRPEDVAASVEGARLSRAPGAAAERNIQQNAEFLVGDVLVQLIFPESQGYSEDWTDREIADATSGAYAAATAFQTMFGYAPMHFVLKAETRVPTTYEPIQTGMNDHGQWIREAMIHLGIDPGKTTDLMVHDYNNAGRAYYRTDWAFTAFIADGSSDPDHRFSDGYYTAYALLGGPYLVIPNPAGENPFDIDPWLVFSTIFQHEMSHVFWALDEYPGPNNLSDCSSHTGYLNYYNMNKVEELEPGVFESCPGWEIQLCTMWRAKEDLGRPICPYTQGQLGLIDNNRNSIPDVFDAAPTAEFLPAAAETIQTPDVTVRIKAISQAVRNMNPIQALPDRVNYAPPLQDATLTINGIGGIHLMPLDGKWDETTEDLSMTVNGVPVGMTEFGVVVRSSFGRSSYQIVKRVYFPGIKFALFDVDPHAAGIRVSWSTVGETFGARLDLHRIDTAGGEQDTTRIAADLQPERSSGGFHQYEFIDGDVVPGRSYRYFVKGYFSIVYPDRTVEYELGSDTHQAQSMFPIPSGAVASFVSPNPFSAKTQISVRIPVSEALSGASSSSSAQSLRTDVNVTVYDVAGREVKKIYNGSAFSGVRTFDWNGTSDNGDKVPSGVYFVKTIAGSTSEVRKVVVVR
jgi:hypothetical protein